MYKYFNIEQDPNMHGVSEKLMCMLDNARSIAKVPFIITSGVRSVEKNEKVGGKKDSSHLNGLAVDLSCLDSNTRYRIISSLLVAGFKRIGWDEVHIHTDIDLTKPQEVIFLE